MNNDRYNENEEKHNNKPNYILRRIGAGVLLVFAFAVGAKLAQETKEYMEHLRNPYTYSEENKTVVIHDGEGLIYAVKEIGGFKDEFDYRPIVEYVKDIPENEDTLNGSEIVPDGAGISVPVSMEKNES